MNKPYLLLYSRVLIFAFLLFCGNNAFSQPGEWVWIHGDSITEQPAVYGVQGVANPANHPPSLYEPCEWTDLNGNFWLFGGINNSGVHGDLWKYNPITNQWIWVKGNGTVNDPGSYGTIGVASQSNRPPARAEGVVTWVDAVGNLWLFGGIVIYQKNDLWKYDISTNQWTWIKGPNTSSDPGLYGTKGVPNIANNPCARWKTGAGWTDNAGDFWLFGGATISSVLNDLWRYHIATNEWTWMKGDSTTGAAGVYGTLGVENPANTPSARTANAHWKDPSGNLWLFGGANVSGAYNDMWRYNTATNMWAWIGGDIAGNIIGISGTKCDLDSANIPRGRYDDKTAWTDQQGNFWLFGGFGYGGTRTNDLWKYCYTSNIWIWQSGDSTLNPPGSWGTQGISNPANMPPGRGGAVGWTDHNGHLYVFGGWGVPGNYDDIWKYTMDSTCGVCPVASGITEIIHAEDFFVFPNPASSSFSISFPSSDKQIMELRIYNTLGKQVYVEKEEITEGKFEKQINVEKWSDGIYFLQVKMQEDLFNKKIVIQH
ncbi:MAG: kelch repeat-containing protein [Bacteroidia bacterium]